MSASTVPAPGGISAPFWDATRREQLSMQRCTDCERLVWYPRALCPHCGGTALEWQTLSGRGRVYAASVHHRSIAPHLADATPYAVVLVDLDEGVRMMSAVLGAAVRTDDLVTVDWFPLEDGRRLPVFSRCADH